ncbi:APC family permease [Acetonema longum]|uniref:Amino acid transporter n=1 Tax=Acetonema longum DSM 6540 TaxID=1009370 RepID=F7NIN1_9FIRM|nr:APC family permease [Acetonema longum]EGO64095.1 amino acid transporter [Acetonema longum DSM 6540]
MAERLPKWKALAIFSSDALSSVGYGPEQIALVLAASGLAAYGYYPYAFLVVLSLLAVVTVSYTQVARANPGGGGSYSVAKKNLGEYPALVAAAALFADYVLTVAVSITAGTQALVSAFPALREQAISIDIFVLFAILTLVNLRGVRESAHAFVFPTYLFVLGMLGLIVTGVYQAITGPGPVFAAESLAKQELDWVMLALVLRAFANGCSSMTGLEAISNGVPMFKPPEHANAIKTTYWMSGLLAIMLTGISFLLLHYHILPMPHVTMLSQIAEQTLGRGWFYYYIQMTTMLILFLAANTAYNGLPPLLSLLAQDGYMPRYLGLRGERLSFSNGILLLSLVAGLLIVAFDGEVEHLISLYAVGVFLSFTIAQSGMVVHWWRQRDRNWRRRALVNGFGAMITGIVVVVIAVSKFFAGAWIVLIFIPVMIFIFKKIKGHYLDMAEQLRLPLEEGQYGGYSAGKHYVIVPVASPTRVVANTMRYAKMIGDEIIALHVATDKEEIQRVEEKWKQWNPDVKLVTVYSPYRLVIQPVIQFVEKLIKRKRPEDFITIVIPEFETRKWWHRLLHNQTGLILRTMLIFSKDVAVTTLPFQLKK